MISSARHHHRVQHRRNPNWDTSSQRAALSWFPALLPSVHHIVVVYILFLPPINLGKICIMAS